MIPSGRSVGRQVTRRVTAYSHERGYKGPSWPDSLIVKYKDDGTVDSVVKLESPRRDRHFEAWRFAAFLDGTFLVTGAYLTDEHIPGEPVTRIFNRGGAFVQPLELPHDLPRARRSSPWS